MVVERLGPNEPRQAAHVDAWVIDDEVVLYDPRRARMHVCNATAALIWQLCDGEHDVDSIVAAVAAVYPAVSPTAIAADVAGLVVTLRTEEIVS